MSDNGVVKHAGWLPSNPSMTNGTDLAPDAPGLNASVAEGKRLVHTPADYPGSPFIDGDSGTVSTRIMDNSIEYEWPGSDQGNLEHTGPAVRGAR